MLGAQNYLKNYDLKLMLEPDSCTSLGFMGLEPKLAQRVLMSFCVQLENQERE